MTSAPLLRPDAAAPPPHRPRATTGRLLEESSLRVGLAGCGLFVLTGLLAAVRPADVVGVVLMLGTAALMARGLTPTGAAGIGIAAWAFCEGFVLHREGELHVAPADLWLLVVSVAVCVAPAALGARAATGGGGRRG